MRKKVIFLILLVTLLLFCTSCNFEERNIQGVQNAAYRHLNSMFDDVTVENVSSSDNTYYALCDVNSTGKFFDLSAQLELEFTKNGETWELIDEPIYKSRQFNFHSGNAEFYYYGHRNCSELFQIQNMSENTITIKNYGHDLVNTGQFYGGGRDDYYNGTETWSLTYLKDLQCFEFSYYDVGTPYRVYSDHLEVGHETSNMGTRYTEYNEIYPKDPDNYWWFDRAS